MSKLSQAQVTAALASGGFSASGATTMAAIAHAESQLDPNAIGDVALENSTWGPSVGLFQIRTLKADTGTGSDRDIQYLQGSVAHQVAAALHISNGGRNFGPWTTYADGDYQKYLGGAAGSSSTVAESAGFVQDKTGELLGKIAAPLVSGLQSTAYTVAFAGLGLALIGGGIYAAFGTQIRAGARTAAKVALL